MQSKTVVVRSILIGLLFLAVSTIYSYGAAYLPLASTGSSLEQNLQTAYLRPASTDPNRQNKLQDSNSIWFQNKYDAKMKPFWNADHIKISDDVAKWWYSIQASKPVDLKSTLNSLFDQGVPKYQNSTFSKKKNRLACAVVGNSANLKDSEYGQPIDSHDVVIRFNKGPTSGFEKDVGSKTTHRIIYPESATHISKETSLILVPFKPLDVEWLLSAITTGRIRETYMPVQRRISCNVSRIAILHPEFIRHVHTNWLNKKGRYPSTGAIGVGVALQLCDQVDIYGFGADKYGSWQHYYEKLPDKVASAFRKTDVHNGDKQEEFLEKLSSEGIAQLHRGRRI